MDSHNVKVILSKYIDYLKENPIKHAISALDFSSLYPSLIMAYNLSPEYLILDSNYKEELKDKGYNIHKINFEYNYKNHLEETLIKNIKAWTVRHNENNKENTMFGLYPSILRDLFKQRAEMKKELFIYKEKKEHMEKYEKDYLENKEYKECLFKLKYCDTKQKALKVFMNTFYGEMGNKNSPFFQLPLAGGVTSAGQYNLLLIKDYVESLGHDVYYGDSVTGDTPIIIKKNNLINIVPIEEINWNDKDYNIEQYYNDKEIIIDNNTEVYTENGWTKIKKCIRHYTNKKLYRITTNIGFVIVTEDHSLLNKNKEKIKPGECKIGTELLHWDKLKINIDLDYNIDLTKNIYCNSQIEAQKIYLYLLQNKYKCTIEYYNNKYKIIINNKSNNLDYTIKKIEFMGYSNNYVYDLETESHHFAAGIGQLVVHNTDSLYMTCPKEYYLELDKEYYTNQISKEEYNNKLILQTFIAIEDINIKVNKHLYENNGTKYLKMSYEEVLFPIAFLSKKKYYGIPHEHIPNFHPKDLFIRGLEVKKRGVSEILKIICMDLMWKSMSLNNTKTLRELVIDKIKEIFTTKWNLEDFIQTGVWKPEKKNITLNNFAERMKLENKSLPTPGERFNYVIIKRYPYKYDYKGRQKELTKADKMEYLEIVKKYNYEIDLKYYFDKQLTGQFARLISYDTEFEFQIIDSNNNLIIDDDKTINNCKKFILKLVNEHNNNFIDRKSIFKGLYSNVNKKYQSKKNKIYENKFNILLNTKCTIQDESNIYQILIDNINYYLEKNNDYLELDKIIIKKNNKIKKESNNKYNNKLVTLYNNTNSSYYIKQKKYLNNEFNKKIEELLQLLSQHNLQDKIFNIDNLNLINIVTHIRNEKKLDDLCDLNIEDNNLDSFINDESIESKLNEDDLYINIDKELLNKVYNLYIQLISIKKNILIHDNIYNVLYKKLFSNSEYIQKPKKIDRLNFN